MKMLFSEAWVELREPIKRMKAPGKGPATAGQRRKWCQLDLQGPPGMSHHCRHCSCRGKKQPFQASLGRERAE